MRLFAAKIGLALHYHITTRPLSSSGVVYPLWFTNFQSLVGKIPNTLGSLFPQPKTLRQGRWNVERQFQYDSVQDGEGTFSAHVATFRFSFMTLAFVAESPVPGEFGGIAPLRPGCLVGRYPYGLQRLSEEELATRYVRMRTRQLS
jgi:hypothetical protein